MERSRRGGSLETRVEVPEGATTRKILLLLVDISGSMEEAMPEVNRQLESWISVMAKTPSWTGSLDLGIITFGKGGVRALALRGRGETARTGPEAFTPIEDVTCPVLSAGSVTPMLDAIERGLELLREYKDYLRSGEVGYSYFRPYVVLVTDGYPTDAEGYHSEAVKARVTATARRLIEEQNGKHVMFRAIAVENANQGVLSELAGTDQAVNGIAEQDWAKVLELVSNSLEVATSAREVPEHGGPESPQGRLSPELEEEHSDLMQALVSGADWEY